MNIERCQQQEPAQYSLFNDNKYQRNPRPLGRGGGQIGTLMPIQIKNNQTTIVDTVCGNSTHMALASKILKKEGPQGFQGGISPANY